LLHVLLEADEVESGIALDPGDITGAVLDLVDEFVGDEQWPLCDAGCGDARDATAGYFERGRSGPPGSTRDLQDGPRSIALNLLGCRDADLHCARIQDDCVALVDFVDQWFAGKRRLAGSENKLPASAAGQIGEKVQCGGVNPLLIANYLRELNRQPLTGIDACKPQMIQVSRGVEEDGIAEKSPRPPVEGVVKGIVQHEADLVRAIPDSRLRGGAAVQTRLQGSRRHHSRGREKTKAKRPAIQYVYSSARFLTRSGLM